MVANPPRAEAERSPTKRVRRGVPRRALAASLTLVPFACVLLSAASAGAADLTVSDTLTIGSPATYDNVIVTGTGRLTLLAALTVNANMTIDSGGVVTHAVRDTPG